MEDEHQLFSQRLERIIRDWLTRAGCTWYFAQIQRYRPRSSGSLLDRIDLHVEAPPLTIEELRQIRPGKSSAVVRGYREHITLACLPILPWNPASCRHHA